MKEIKITSKLKWISRLKRREREKSNVKRKGDKERENKSKQRGKRRKYKKGERKMNIYWIRERSECREVGRENWRETDIIECKGGEANVKEGNKSW